MTRVLYQNEDDDIEVGINSHGQLYIETLSDRFHGQNYPDTPEYRKKIERIVAKHTGKYIFLADEELTKWNK